MVGEVMPVKRLVEVGLIEVVVFGANPGDLNE